MIQINNGNSDNDGLGQTLRSAISDINSNFSELSAKTETLAFTTTTSIEPISINKPLEIGKYYLIDKSIADDFSNVGYVSGNIFQATGIYPVIWNSSSLSEIAYNIEYFQDDFNGIFSLDYDNEYIIYKYTISTDKFFPYKTLTPSVISTTKILEFKSIDTDNKLTEFKTYK